MLFSDASRIDLGAFAPDSRCPGAAARHRPARTILLRTVAAVAVLGELSVEEAAILVVVLALTDAAPGQAAGLKQKPQDVARI